MHDSLLSAWALCCWEGNQTGVRSFSFTPGSDDSSELCLIRIYKYTHLIKLINKHTCILHSVCVCVCVCVCVNTGHGLIASQCDIYIYIYIVYIRCVKICHCYDIAVIEVGVPACPTCLITSWLTDDWNYPVHCLLLVHALALDHCTHTLNNCLAFRISVYIRSSYLPYCYLTSRYNTSRKVP